MTSIPTSPTCPSGFTAEQLELQVTTENLRAMAHSFDHLVLDIERLRSVVIEHA